MNLTLTKERAIEAYNKADKLGKDLLKNLLGKEVFVSINPMETVKNFVDVCEAEGVNCMDYEVRDSWTPAEKVTMVQNTARIGSPWVPAFVLRLLLRSRLLVPRCPPLLQIRSHIHLCR